jgi:hypothetical protein
MKKINGSSKDLVSENVSALKTIFPEAFTEDKINFEILRQLLGDTVDEGEEKYGLNWHGKKKARQIALTPSTGTLRPCPGESVDWDTTQNLFIEGDNLEVLKLLQKSYANKVKMIYIDPPYNTGNEFIYPHLLLFPKIGSERNYLSKNLLALPFKNYMIYYRCRDEQVEIVRILHGSLDMERVFKDERF